MGNKLKVVAVLAVMAAFHLLDTQVALAQDTDGITVHCVNVTIVDPRFASCEDQHLTIQDGVNHAEAEETVLVGAGTYPEQVTIIRALMLSGAGATLTTIRPISVITNTSSIFSGAPIAAILLVDGATGVAVTDLTIDGSTAAFNACSPGYVGIFFRASSGAIEDTHVTNIHHPLASGCQAVLGIFVQSGTVAPS